jgi:hypothetical protein
VTATGDTSSWRIPAEHDVPFEPNLSLDVVEVWRDDRDLLWRWRYRGQDGTELMANRSYPTRDAAVASAGVAYPGLLIRDRPEPPARPAHRLRKALVLLVVMLVVAVAGIGLILVAAVLRTAVAIRAAKVRRSSEGPRGG